MLCWTLFFFSTDSPSANLVPPLARGGALQPVGEVHLGDGAPMPEPGSALLFIQEAAGGRAAVTWAGPGEGPRHRPSSASRFHFGQSKHM